MSKRNVEALIQEHEKAIQANRRAIQNLEGAKHGKTYSTIREDSQ